jgi:hypothetical protein
MQTRYAWIRFVIGIVFVVLFLLIGRMVMNVVLGSPNDPRAVLGGVRGQSLIFVRTFRNDQPIWQLSIGVDSEVSQSTYGDTDTFPPPTPARMIVSEKVQQELTSLRLQWCSQPPTFPNVRAAPIYHAVAVQCPGFAANRQFLIPDAELPPVLADLLAIPESP